MDPGFFLLFRPWVYVIEDAKGQLPPVTITARWMFPDASCGEHAFAFTLGISDQVVRGLDLSLRLERKNFRARCRDSTLEKVPEHQLCGLLYFIWVHFVRQLEC